MGVLFCFVFCYFWFSVKRNYAEIYKSTDNPTDGEYTIKPDNLPAFWWCILWPNVEGNTAYAEYNLFSDMSEKDKYKLILGSYSDRTVISSLLF